MLVHRHDRDLLGEPVPHPSLLRADGRRRKIGYADLPGTGPKGQRCGTCRFCHRILAEGGAVHKCEIVAHLWGPTSLTDINLRAPACLSWERKPRTPLLS